VLKTEKSKNVTVKYLLVIIALLIIPFQTLAVQNCMDASQLGPVYYMQPN